MVAPLNVDYVDDLNSDVYGIQGGSIKKKRFRENSKNKKNVFPKLQNVILPKGPFTMVI